MKTLRFLLLSVLVIALLLTDVPSVYAEDTNKAGGDNSPIKKVMDKIKGVVGAIKKKFAGNGTKDTPPVKKEEEPKAQVEKSTSPEESEATLEEEASAETMETSGKETVQEATSEEL